MPKNNTSIDTKHSSVYTVSFEGISGEHQNISFTHSVEADNASQAVGSAILACRKRYIGASVDLESIVVNW